MLFRKNSILKSYSSSKQPTQQKECSKLKCFWKVYWSYLKNCEKLKEKKEIEQYSVNSRPFDLQIQGFSRIFKDFHGFLPFSRTFFWPSQNSRTFKDFQGFSRKWPPWNDTIFDNFGRLGHFEVKYLDFWAKSEKMSNLPIVLGILGQKV